MLLILFPDKFTKSVFYKLQIKYLKDRLNTKVEINDLFTPLNKNWEKAFSEKRYGRVKVFKKISEWKKYFKSKIQSEKKLYVMNLLDFNSFKSLIIHYELYKSKVKIIQLRSPEVCVENKSNYYNFFQKISKAIELTFTNFARLVYFIKMKFLYKLGTIMKFEELIVLYSGKKKNLLPNLNSKKISYESIHSSDYSNHLLLKSVKKKKKLTNRSFIVFLDGTAPYFIDDLALYGYKINYDQVTWYKDLNNFLKLTEEHFKSRVIIIPHPRVRHRKNPYYDKRFEIGGDVGASNKLIPNSKFVLAITPSTAVSYCVINYKPVTLIYNEQIKKNNLTAFSDMKFMSKVLKTGFININNEFYKNKFSMTINKKIYDKYKYDYLTSKKISGKMNYEIINGIL